jgi:hypothetical protein
MRQAESSVPMKYVHAIALSIGVSRLSITVGTVLGFWVKGPVSGARPGRHYCYFGDPLPQQGSLVIPCPSEMV